jgi:hypothetical protein
MLQVGRRAVVFDGGDGRCLVAALGTVIARFGARNGIQKEAYMKPLIVLVLLAILVSWKGAF